MESGFRTHLLMVKRTAAVLLLCLPVLSARAQDALINFSDAIHPPADTELMRWHEVFTYEVRYSIFKLGEVKVEVVRDTVYQGKKGWHLRTIITSSPGIPFVGREENHYNSIFELTEDLPHTLVYWTDNVDEGKYDESRYRYDYERNKVFAREEEEADTLDLEEPASSGQLIFIISRLYAGTNETFKIPIFLNLEKGYIEVANSTEKEEREYAAFPEPVETYYSEGSSTIEGPFGFRGDFKSWYLADNLRVPLEAHVRVWLGNVRIKLIDYKKELW